MIPPCSLMSKVARARRPAPLVLGALQGILVTLAVACGTPSPAPETSSPEPTRAQVAVPSTSAASAQVATGNAYGVPQDPVRAMTYYLTAAEQGDAYAQDNLALMYFTGQGVPQDYVLAALWYRKAAEQGYTDAQFNLAGMYFTGQGVAKDAIEAHKWYNLAAAKASADDQARYQAWGAATAKQMTAEQLAAARTLAREWQAAFDKAAR